MLAGDDLLLNNVISFEVRLVYDGATTFTGGNAHYPAADLSTTLQNNDPLFTGKGVFDTWYKDAAGNWANPSTTDSVPLRLRARAVQIKLRVWDQKNKLTRQTTIIQEI